MVLLLKLNIYWPISDENHGGFFDRDSNSGSIPCSVLGCQQCEFHEMDAHRNYHTAAFARFLSGHF